MIIIWVLYTDRWLKLLTTLQIVSWLKKVLKEWVKAMCNGLVMDTNLMC